MLNLAGSDALDKYDTFTFANEDEREDPDVILQKFEEICLPVKNVIIDRHAFNTTDQKPNETIQSYVSNLRALAKN